MPKASPARARLPRGTKPVTQAFFDALQAIPEHSRAEVAKAAHAGIRDALKAEREQAKEERARESSAGIRVRNAEKSKSAGTRSTGKAATRAPKRASRSAAGPGKRRARTTARAQNSERIEETQVGGKQSGEDGERSTAAGNA